MYMHNRASNTVRSHCLVYVRDWPVLMWIDFDYILAKRFQNLNSVILIETHWRDSDLDKILDSTTPHLRLTNAMWVDFGCILLKKKKIPDRNTLMWFRSGPKIGLNFRMYDWCMCKFLQGLVSRNEMELFKVPIYFPSPEEVTQLYKETKVLRLCRWALHKESLWQFLFKQELGKLMCRMLTNHFWDWDSWRYI